MGSSLGQWLAYRKGLIYGRHFIIFFLFLPLLLNMSLIDIHKYHKVCRTQFQLNKILILPTLDVNHPKKNQTDKQFITCWKSNLILLSWGLGLKKGHIFTSSSVFWYHNVFLLFYYFRNFEESEDELRNEVVESLEKLATFNEAEKREEVSSSLKMLET